MSTEQVGNHAIAMWLCERGTSRYGYRSRLQRSREKQAVVADRGVGVDARRRPTDLGVEGTSKSDQD